MRHADFQRPIAVITGATSGIGAAFARRLAADGYDLVVTGRRKEKISQLVKEIEERYGTQVETILCELSNIDHVDRLVRRLVEKDEVAVLVNNAGYGLSQPFADADVETSLTMLKVHIDASLRLIHAVLPSMRKRQKGSIINVSSLASLIPLPEGSVYAATKAFLTVFTESLYLELRRDNIRLQALLPGFTRTDFHDQMVLRADKSNPDQVAADPRHGGGMLRFMSAEKVVDKSLRALRRGRVICIPGGTNRTLALFVRLLPRKVVYALVSKATVNKR